LNNKKPDVACGRSRFDKSFQSRLVQLFPLQCVMVTTCLGGNASHQ